MEEGQEGHLARAAVPVGGAGGVAVAGESLAVCLGRWRWRGAGAGGGVPGVGHLGAGGATPPCAEAEGGAAPLHWAAWGAVPPAHRLAGRGQGGAPGRPVDGVSPCAGLVLPAPEGEGEDAGP